MVPISLRNILFLFFTYSLLTAIYHVVKIDAIKYVIFAFSTLLIILSTVYVCYNLKFLNYKIFIFSFLWLSFLLLNSIVNYERPDLPYSLKYSGLIAVFNAAYIYGKKANEGGYYETDIFKSHNISVLIVLLPFVIYFYNFIFNAGVDNSSLFLNRNNAVLYGLITSGVFYLINKKNVSYLFLIIVNIVMYKTVGAFVGGIIALLFFYFYNVKIKTIVYSILMIIVIVIPIFYMLKSFDIALIHRIQEVVDTLNVMKTLTFNRIVNMSYGEMVILSGSEEQSMLFRIKHWFEIISIFFESNIINQLFGHGNDSIHIVTYSGLRAHNDYLRLLFEVGFMFFINFILFNFYILKRVGVSLYSIPIIVVFIYFGSENLIDNFLAMSIFYFYMGILASKNESCNDESVNGE